MRKDRNGLEGGVVLYFRKMFVLVREDLNIPGLECLWVEIHTPQARVMLYWNFLLSTKFQADHTCL
jgi:hypothetical protein